jgi:hypothetical protein
VTDEETVKCVWKSAHAVEDWPGKVTIRRYSPFKKFRVEGEGATVSEAWKNTADRVRRIWRMAAEGVTEQDIAETMPPERPR